MLRAGAFEQRLPQGSQDLLLAALQEDGGEHIGDIRVHLRGFHEFLGVQQRVVVVAAFEMQHHRLVDEAFCVAAALPARQGVCGGRFRFHVQLQQSAGEKRVDLGILAAVQRLVDRIERASVIPFLIFLRRFQIACLDIHV